MKILNQKIWKRNCPKCGCNILYKYNQGFYRAVKENRICLECYYSSHPSPNKGKHPSDKTKRKISFSLKGRKVWNKGIPMSDKTKKKLSHSLKNLPVKMSSWHIGKKTPLNVIKKLQKSHVGQVSSMKGKHHTDETRHKIRKSILDNLKNRGISQKSNPIACQFIDKLNEERGWDLQHAKNGGEVEIYGYSLDGYDKEKSVVFEYDEPRHHLKSKKEKDIKRQNDIFNYFKKEGKSISFWRYDERYKNLYEVYPQ